MDSEEKKETGLATRPGHMDPILPDWTKENTNLGEKYIKPPGIIFRRDFKAPRGLGRKIDSCD